MTIVSKKWFRVVGERSAVGKLFILPAGAFSKIKLKYLRNAKSATPADNFVTGIITKHQTHKLMAQLYFINFNELVLLSKNNNKQETEKNSIHVQVTSVIRSFVLMFP